MQIQGFSCTRPQPEHMDQMRACATAAELDGLVTAGAYTTDVSRALYRIAANLDTEELRITVSKRLQAACSSALASATDASFDNLPDIAFALLTAMNGTTRAVFELGAEARLVELLRTQMRVLCRGYLAAAARER